MSARERRLILRDSAKSDLRGILLYTQKTWGAEQRRRYRTQLLDAMNSLRSQPERGRQRAEFFVGCRSLVVGQHVIYYVAVQEEILILRLFHQSQDPKHLEFT